MWQKTTGKPGDGTITDYSSSKQHPTSKLKQIHTMGGGPCDNFTSTTCAKIQGSKSTMQEPNQEKPRSDVLEKNMTLRQQSLMKIIFSRDMLFVMAIMLLMVLKSSKGGLYEFSVDHIWKEQEVGNKTDSSVITTFAETAVESEPEPEPAVEMIEDEVEMISPELLAEPTIESLELKPEVYTGDIQEYFSSLFIKAHSKFVKLEEVVSQVIGDQLDVMTTESIPTLEEVKLKTKKQLDSLYTLLKVEEFSTASKSQLSNFEQFVSSSKASVVSFSDKIMMNSEMMMMDQFNITQMVDSSKSTFNHMTNDTQQWLKGNGSVPTVVMSSVLGITGSERERETKKSRVYYYCELPPLCPNTLRVLYLLIYTLIL
jgi:hypothetical protein